MPTVADGAKVGDDVASMNTTLRIARGVLTSTALAGTILMDPHADVAAGLEPTWPRVPGPARGRGSPDPVRGRGSSARYVAAGPQARYVAAGLQTRPSEDTPDAHVALARTAAGDTYQNLFNFLCAAPAPRGEGAGAVPRGGGPPGGGRSAGPPDRAAWYAAPVKVFDNLYFVGQIASTPRGR